MSHVFDATAIMALLNLEVGADRVERLISQSDRDAPTVFMSVINWGEIYYGAWRNYGREVADRRLNELSRLPIAIVDADEQQALLAAELKSVYKLPYADGFAAALAIIRGAKLVTADADFLNVSRQVDIVWLGKRLKRR